MRRRSLSQGICSNLATLPRALKTSRSSRTPRSSRSSSTPRSTQPCVPHGTRTKTQQNRRNHSQHKADS
ncbi:unnamed protein product [Lasius platythorax]|uniref:Uncharacterized protein n=1 Tax=Lasius platythorax TaxID=488582 RepID=A0AAV2N016_9HYME